jgi:WD40 repeat protein
LPLDEALPVALQIAEALEAAHEQGIVHRDLKPANIKVRADGTVKVLDFGLAKAIQSPMTSERQDLANSPTVTSPAMTQAGIILGTAAYMAPEQAKGRAVDKRCDVWAFGVVIYEMLTGRRAFEGEDVSDLLVAVLSKDVDMDALPAGTPPGKAHLLRRCLVRDPRHRLRDIGEARITLASITSGADDHAAPGAAPATAAGRGRWVWPAIATAALAALVASPFWVPWRASEPSPVRVLDVPGTAGVRFLALAPDGASVAYSAADGLYLRRLDATGATRLVERNDVQSLTFSPDGDTIAFYTGNDIRLIRRDGSGGRTLLGGAWRNDVQLAWVGDALYWPTIQGIRMTPNAGGESTLVMPRSAIPSSRAPFRNPVVLEGGRTILVNPGLGENDRFDFGTVWAFREGRATQVLSFPRAAIDGLAYDTASRSLLVSAVDAEQSAVWTAPFDLESLTAGPAQPLLAGRTAAASDVGTIALATGEAARTAALKLEWRGPDGALIRSIPQRMYDLRSLALSPDGRRLAVRAITEFGEGGTLWVLDLETGVPSPVSDVNFAQSAWSPDSRRLAFAAFDGTLQVVSYGAAAAPQILGKDVSDRSIPTWTPDGRRIVYSRQTAAPGMADIVEVDAGGAAPEKVVGTIAGARALSLSPNGRWLAYEAHGAIAVTDYPALAVHTKISADQSAVPQWSPDGSEVWFVKGRELVGVGVGESAEGLTSTPARRVWSAPEGTELFSALGQRGFGTVEGKQFLVRQPAPEGDWRITIVQNLPELLRRSGSAR